MMHCANNSILNKQASHCFLSRFEDEEVSVKCERDALVDGLRYENWWAGGLGINHSYSLTDPHRSRKNLCRVQKKHNKI